MSHNHSLRTLKEIKLSTLLILLKALSECATRKSDKCDLHTTGSLVSGRPVSTGYSNKNNHYLIMILDFQEFCESVKIYGSFFFIIILY